jgi:hypothetical protein
MLLGLTDTQFDLHEARTSNPQYKSGHKLAFAYVNTPDIDDLLHGRQYLWVRH